MACTLRDQLLSLVLIAASLLRNAEAAPLVVDNAHLTLHRPQELLFDLDLPSAGNLTVAQAEQAAASLATSWSFTSPPAFAQLAEPSESLEQVLESIQVYSSVIVVLPGGQPPVRPEKNSAAPFLTLTEASATHTALTALPLSQINQAAAAASSYLGYAFYPLMLDVKNFNRTSETGPWVLYDVSAGIVCLDTRVLDNMHQLPVAMAEYTAEFARGMFNRLPAFPYNTWQQAANTTALGTLFSTAAAAAATAVTSQVPLWYCFTCPILLGLLFPFIFNFGLGEVADKLCQLYNLPTEQCNELWYGAFALAMILSFASVLPIISVCRLAQCARPSSPSLA